MTGEEFALLRHSVEQWAAARSGSAAIGGSAATGGAGALWREIAALGWVGLAAPEAVGGLGGSGREEAVVAAGLGRALSPVPYASGSVMAADLLGRARDAAELLPDIIAGSVRYVVADEEAGLPFRALPRTELLADGDGLRVRGAKCLVPDPREAEMLLIPVREAATGEPAIVRVAAADRGLACRMGALLDGRAVATVAIDARIAPAAVLLRGPEADRALSSARDRAAVAWAAEAIGAMEGALDLTRAHLGTRRQFGQPLAAFQVLRHRVADMVSELELARSAVTAAAAALEDVARRPLLASVAKARAASAGRFVGEQAVQLHGGIGVTSECGAGRYYQRLLVLEALGGGRDDHLDRVAARYAS